MLTLKMMGPENVADSNPSKTFTLVMVPARSNIHFTRRDSGCPSILVTDLDGEAEEYLPEGNTYVLENGKTVATFAHMAPPEGVIC